jgi:hypothetical protein
MSTERKPEPGARKTHMEKPIMQEPQEEFVGDEAQPSKDISELQPSEIVDREAAGEQKKP